MSDLPILPPIGLQPLAQGAARTVWSLDTKHPFEAVRDPLFMRHHHLVATAGDQIIFSCGPPEARVHGTLVVTEVRKPTAGSPGEVRTVVIGSTAA